MTFVTRLKVATALLGVAAAVTCTQVLGDSSRDDGPLGAKSPAADRWADGLAASKFANTPVLTYETGKGEHLFALQLRPGLPEAAPADTARPRDLLILIDTSASQAGKPYLLAQEIAAALIRDASPADRVSLWTLNTPGATRDLANGFQEPRSPALQNALKRLKEVEYPSGASDLKDGLRRVLKTFEPRFSRQQVLLFIGDAQSAYNPLAEPERLALAAELRASLVGFFAVPLGPDIHAENLHTLVAGTGGAVVRVPVRLKGAERMNELVARFNEAVRVPVLMPDEFRLPEGVAEFFPTKLPPLRADAPTLVVGKFKGGPVKLEGTVKGTVAGRPVTVAFAHDAPAPQADNYFLASVLDQWRAAPRPDAPALLRADRTLALAYEQCRLARTELLSQAHWAVHEGEYGAAKNLYLAAAALDPADQEARFGLKVAEKLRQGELTKKDLEDKAEAKGEGLLIRPTREQQVNAVRVRLEELAGQEQPPPPPAPAVPGADELLRQEQARRAVVEQRTRIVVEETLRRARQLLATDPEGAADLLKRQLDAVLQDPDLSENVRRSLAANLEAMLREVTVRGAMIRQRAEEERRRIARARAAIAAQERLAALAERQRERIRAFAALMNQARYEEAYREALIMQQEAVNLGLPVPIETTASYIIGENATNLRELQELRRIREERFLLTMMQVEKSHVPYPDEPPVHFPPAAVWRELFQQRKGYELSGLGQPESPQTQLMRNKLDEPFTNERAFDGVPLEAALEVIGLKTGITFLIDTAAFKAEDATREITQQGVRLPVLRNVSLATALRMMLDDIGATYQVRRDYIDIVPISKAYADKVVRVFPVADLVIPIPQSVNPAVLQQNLQLLGSSATILGQGLLGVLGSAPPGFLAGGGFQFGGGFGAFGAGAFGALGAAGGIQGLAGGGLQGGNAGFGGGPFQGGGNVNLGFGGGVLGFGGGQLGQFGNLGGQFGLQGGNQADILIALIQQVVEPGYWGTTTPGVIQQGQNDPLLQEGVEPVAPLEQLNTIGFYPPANALVVRGFSRRFAPLERPMRRSDPLGGG
ncbi:MAG TPA: vWA domain-containing protein, partial [Gemmataceae bacterium]